MNRLYTTLFCLASALMASAAFTYTNPILYADYANPDVIRIEKDFYMTAGGRNCAPALPILYSSDMTHWQIVSYALPCGNQSGAPSIRQRNDTVYVVWGDPEKGIFQTHTRITKNLEPHLLNPAHWDFGRWSEPVLLIPGRGLTDATPLWDANGKVYIVHALAGEQASLQSVLCIAEVNNDLTEVITPSRIVFDGHNTYPSCENPKLYKKGSYYYIFCPVGNDVTGSELVLRSKNIYGPYESRKVLAQNDTTISAPRHGAWVSSTDGKDWFFHTQNAGAFGHVLNLQPVKWTENWPVIGLNGAPIVNYPQDINPKSSVKADVSLVKRTYNSVDGSDLFKLTELCKQWQWKSAPQVNWYFCHAADSLLRLYSVRTASANLMQAGNLLLQKPTAAAQTFTACVSFHPTADYAGERAGLILTGTDYAALVLVKNGNNIELQQVVNAGAAQDGKERVAATASNITEQVWLRIRIETLIGTDHPVKAHFLYSLDGNSFQPLGDTFDVKAETVSGAKWGLFCTRPDLQTNDGGYLDVHSVQITNE